MAGAAEPGSGDQAQPAQQRRRVGVAANETAEQYGRIFAIAALQNLVAEVETGLAAEDALLRKRVKASASSTSAHL